MMDQEAQKNLALAGVCQAAALVQMSVRKGNVPEHEFKASLNSIVLTDPENTEQVFGGLLNVKTGLETLVAQLSGTPVDKDAEITRYIANLLGLERKLAKQPKRMQELSQRIEQIKRQQSHMDLFETQMLSNLASVYSDVVSPAGPKIQVAGIPELLKQQTNQHKVRALLLAGIRAAVLWRQLGGKRRQILFNRKRIVSSAQQLLRQLQLN